MIDTGWLPIRLSVLEDPEVQAAAANAAVVLEQAQSPYESFVTPDYNQITQVMAQRSRKLSRASKPPRNHASGVRGRGRHRRSARRIGTTCLARRCDVTGESSASGNVSSGRLEGTDLAVHLVAPSHMTDKPTAPTLEDRRRRMGYLLIAPAMLVLILVVLFPIIRSVVYSFQRVKPEGGRFRSTWVWFDNYRFMGPIRPCGGRCGTPSLSRW